jgi:hypothetical protein
MSTIIHDGIVPDTDTPIPHAPLRDAIFDSTPYIAPKALIDGNLADEIAVKFGGTWEPTVEWFEKAKLGHTVTLHILAEIVGKNATIKNGEDATIVGTASLKVIDVYLPAPEELV